MCLIDSSIDGLFKRRPISTWSRVWNWCHRELRQRLKFHFYLRVCWLHSSSQPANIFHYLGAHKNRLFTVGASQKEITKSGVIQLWKETGYDQCLDSGHHIFQGYLTVGQSLFQMKFLSVMQQLVHFGIHQLLLHQALSWQTWKGIPPALTLS